MVESCEGSNTARDGAFTTLGAAHPEDETIFFVKAANPQPMTFLKPDRLHTFLGDQETLAKIVPERRI